MYKLALDSLQSFMPPTVSDLNSCSFSAFKPEPLIQLLNISNLGSEKVTFVPKNF